MKLTSENVTNVFINCLFYDNENTDEAIIVEGARMRVGFNPDRIKDSARVIEEMLNDLNDNFKAIGGGWSFLNACMDKYGNQWGEHDNVEELVCLGLAIGKLSFLFPRKMWDMLPGGMPYFVIE